MILTRKNTITGVVYSEDPTVMAVELANEPHTTCAARTHRLKPMHVWIKHAIHCVMKQVPQQFLKMCLHTTTALSHMGTKGLTQGCRWMCMCRMSQRVYLYAPSLQRAAWLL